MKTFLYTSVLTCFILVGHAQEGTVNIQQDEKIAQLLGIYKLGTESANVYRIQVGFGSYQQAQNLKLQVEGDFPDWYSKIDFESPSYRVRLGRFKTKLEAERKLMEVRKKYPQAMLLKPEKTTQ